MSVFCDGFDIDTNGNADIIDISSRILEIVSFSGIIDGIVLVYIPGSTAAITTMEFEHGLISDMRAALERLVPEGIRYSHNEKWHDGNGHSHIRASFIGQSESFPLIKGELMLGTWQQIILIDLDNRPRSRKVVVQVCGE